MSSSSFIKEMRKLEKEKNRLKKVEGVNKKFNDNLQNWINSLSIMISLLDNDLKLNKINSKEFAICDNVHSNNRIVNLWNIKYYIKFKFNAYICTIEYNFSSSEKTKEIVLNNNNFKLKEEKLTEMSSYLGAYIDFYQLNNIFVNNFKTSIKLNCFSKVILSLIDDLIEIKNKKGI